MPAWPGVRTNKPCSFRAWCRSPGAPGTCAVPSPCDGIGDLPNRDPGLTAADGGTGRGAAYERQRWAEAYTQLNAADARTPLDVGDLEHLAFAAYLSGHDQQSTDAWARCYRLHLEADEPEEALRSAFWLGYELMQRGDAAQGGGWMAQADQLAAARHLECVECGYLLVPHALMRLHLGAHSDAFDLFAEAGVMAERFDDDDLRALSCLGRGQALTCMGRWNDGVVLFDQAMTSVTNGLISPVVSGIIYCAVIDQCQEAFDVRRSHEWTQALTHWCDRQEGLVPYRGQCMVHRSHVLRVHGAWSDALDEARRARDRLSDPPHPAIGMAHYELGELYRLRGDLAAAEMAYKRAHELGRSPQPGLALIQLSQGRIEAAAAGIDAALAGAADAVTRARLLPAFVEIMVAADRTDVAEGAADELADLGDRDHVAYLAAAASHATAAVALARNDPREALRSLRVGRPRGRSSRSRTRRPAHGFSSHRRAERSATRTPLCSR